MSYAELARQHTSATTPAVTGRESLDVFAAAQIRADVRRVLYALAIPEYLEAWLEVPETDRIECHAEQGSFDRFRIDLFSSGARRRSIHGSCLLSKPDKITYLWDRERAGSGARSVVEIRLCGGPATCALKLRHSGFCNQAESEWHFAMWRRSLDKLCGLMEGIGFSR